MSITVIDTLDIEGEDFHDPETDEALFDALREDLDERVELLELETDSNDEAFARTIAGKLDEYMREAGLVRLFGCRSALGTVSGWSNQIVRSPSKRYGFVFVTEASL